MEQFGRFSSGILYLYSIWTNRQSPPFQYTVGTLTVISCFKPNYTRRLHQFNSSLTYIKSRVVSRAQGPTPNNWARPLNQLGLVAKISCCFWFCRRFLIKSVRHPCAVVRYLSRQQELYWLPAVPEWDRKRCDHCHRRSGRVSPVCSGHEFCHTEKP